MNDDEQIVPSRLGTTLKDALAGIGIDVTGLRGAQVEDGSVIHHGPAEGGNFLERPTAGYLANTAAGDSVVVDNTSRVDLTTIRRPSNEQGRFTVDGTTYEVNDFLPPDAQVRELADDVPPSRALATVLEPRADRDRQHIPDNDENARDMEALIVEHRKNLDLAVESFDQYQVHTEIHAHGRTLTVDTNFEATAPDNHAEREEAEEHVETALHAGRNDVETSEENMRFRSQVHAYLDSQKGDQGISR